MPCDDCGCNSYVGVGNNESGQAAPRSEVRHCIFGNVVAEGRRYFPDYYIENPNLSDGFCGERRWKRVFTGDEGGIGCTFAIDMEDKLWAWGDNRWGQLGDGSYLAKGNPVQIGSDTWKFIYTTGGSTLGIKTDGSLWGWGKCNAGQLGLGGILPTNATRFRKIGPGNLGYGWEDNTDYFNAPAARAVLSSGIDSVGPIKGHYNENNNTANKPDFNRAPTASVVYNIVRPDITPNIYKAGSGAEFVCLIDGAVQSSSSKYTNLRPLITNGGSGYASAPDVSFEGGGGRGAMAKATVSGGSVVSLEITSGGSEYQTPPTVVFSGGGGSGASATVEIAGPMLEVQVKSPGSGYTCDLPPVQGMGSLGPLPYPQWYTDYFYGDFEEARTYGVSNHYTFDIYPRYYKTIKVNFQASPEDKISYPEKKPEYIYARARLKPAPISSIVPYFGGSVYCRVNVSQELPNGFDANSPAYIKPDIAIEDYDVYGEGFNRATAEVTSYTIDQNGMNITGIAITNPGSGYIFAPDVVIGPPNKPRLVDSGSWTHVSVSKEGAGVGIKSDASIWVWGARPNRDETDGSDTYKEPLYSPTPLGRGLRLYASVNAPPATPFTTSDPQYNKYDSRAVVPFWRKEWDAGEVEITSAQGWGYTSVPTLSPTEGGKWTSVPNPDVGVPAQVAKVSPSGSGNNTLSRLGRTPDETQFEYWPGGNNYADRISGTEVWEAQWSGFRAELSGPSGGVKCYADGFARYVIDSGGSLWIIKKSLPQQARTGPDIRKTLWNTETYFYPGGYQCFVASLSSDEKIGTEDRGGFLNPEPYPNIFDLPTHGDLRKEGSHVIPKTGLVITATQGSEYYDYINDYSNYSPPKAWLRAEVEHVFRTSFKSTEEPEFMTGSCGDWTPYWGYLTGDAVNTKVLVTGPGNGKYDWTVSRTTRLADITKKSFSHEKIASVSLHPEVVWGGKLYSATTVSLSGYVPSDSHLFEPYSTLDVQTAGVENTDVGGSGGTVQVTANDDRYGFSNRFMAECKGAWSNYFPRHGVASSESGTLTFGMRPHEYGSFAGWTVPQEYSGFSAVAEGGVGLKSGDTAWRLPVAFSQPPARINPFTPTVTSSGSGYTEPAKASLSPASATSAASVTCSINGKVIAVGVIEGGSGYKTAPQVSFSNGGAQATATIEGPVSKVTVTGGGGDYAVPPTVVFSDPGIPAKATAAISGGIAEVRMTATGSGYFSAPQVEVDGDGSGAVVTATISGGGKVDRLLLTSRGSKYTSSPTVSITGGGGSDAAAAATVDLDEESDTYGQVINLTLTSRGNGYTSAPEVSITGSQDPGGEPATATATVKADGVVTGFSVVSGGSGYTTPPAIRVGGGAAGVARLSGYVSDVTIVRGGKYRSAPTFSFETKKEVSSLTLTSGGSGYSVPPSVEILGGYGAGAAAVAVLASTLSNATVTVTKGGSGYTSAPRVTLSGGSGEFATATCSVSGGVVTSVTIQSPGGGFLSAPTVTFSGGGGSGAEAKVGLPVSKILLSDSGYGYEKSPRVFFFGGGGTGVAATTQISQAPGSGGSGTTEIDGSVVFVSVTNEGSGLTSRPSVTVPGNAKLQAYVCGTLTQPTVTNPGSNYSSNDLLRYGPTGLEYDKDGKYKGPAATVLGTRLDSPLGGAGAYYSSGYWFDGSWGGGGITSVSVYRSPLRLTQGNRLPRTGSPITGADSIAGTYATPPLIVPIDSFAVAPRTTMRLRSLAMSKTATSISLSNPTSDSEKHLLYSTHHRGVVCGSGKSATACAVQGLLIVKGDLQSGSKIRFYSLVSPFLHARYSKAPSVKIRSVSGTGAKAQLSIDANGVVESASGMTITQSGSGYLNVDGLEFDQGERLVDEPSATATVDASGSVTSISIQSGGGGFYKPPRVVIHGGGGTGAEAVATLVADPQGGNAVVYAVGSVGVVSGGSGYSTSNPPSVSFVHSTEDESIFDPRCVATPTQEAAETYFIYGDDSGTGIAFYSGYDPSSYESGLKYWQGSVLLPRFGQYLSSLTGYERFVVLSALPIPGLVDDVFSKFQIQYCGFGLRQENYGGLRMAGNSYATELGENTYGWQSPSSIMYPAATSPFYYWPLISSQSAKTCSIDTSFPPVAMISDVSAAYQFQRGAHINNCDLSGNPLVVPFFDDGQVTGVDSYRYSNEGGACFLAGVPVPTSCSVSGVGTGAEISISSIKAHAEASVSQSVYGQVASHVIIIPKFD